MIIKCILYVYYFGYTEKKVMKVFWLLCYSCNAEKKDEYYQGDEAQLSMVCT